MVQRQDNAASVRGVALRVTRLASDGSPTVGSACDAYLTGGFITFTFTPQYSTGDEIEIKNAAGEVCVYFKMPDTLKNVTVGLEICDPDPILTQLLVGGLVLSGTVGDAGIYLPPDGESGDTVAVGYAAEKTGVEANPYGVAVEIWAQAVVNGKAAGGAPYWHYLVPYATFRLDGDRVVQNGNLATVFAGSGGGNVAFSAGPKLDLTDVTPTPATGAFDWKWPAVTERPYAYTRTQTAPVGLKGCFANLGTPLTGITAGTPGTLTPSNGNRPANLTALRALGALGNSTRWTLGQYVALLDSTSAWWDGVSWSPGATPASTVAATSATAGIPGTYSPAGATTPTNLAALSSVTAVPTTAWTTGQSVPIGLSGSAHWTSSSWANGPA